MNCWLSHWFVNAMMCVLLCMMYNQEAENQTVQFDLPQTVNIQNNRMLDVYNMQG